MHYKKSIFLLGGLLCLWSACKEKETIHTGESVLIKVNQSTISSPSVVIKDYVLITNNGASDTLEALEIMKIKRDLPSAMQNKDSVLLDSLLAKDFTFRGADEFYTRKDYINNRLNANWKIDTITYRNMALQFFGDMALMTYHNSFKGKKEGNAADREHYNWADIFIKENGKWKLRSMHEIESYMEVDK